MVLLDVASGYSGCGWIDNGDGTSTLSVDINYKPVAGALPPGLSLFGRGILIYNYSKDGSLNPSANLASSITLDGTASSKVYSGQGYVMYSGRLGNWRNTASFVAHYVLRINNSIVSEWPAISVRAGNYTNGDDVGDKNGAAYLRFGENDGVCEKITNPEVPPPLDIEIGMTAPDWNLGELPLGDSEKTFPEVANQLCFTYSAPDVKGKRFLINASDANGTVGNRYRLKNTNDASQFIPYDVSFSGNSVFSLPNVKNVALTMGDSGKTCFVPAFKTTVDNVAEGDYSDVMTFTVIVQP
ncbi:hypothetical protein [Burkholderia sp. 22PA0106]|uniref:hypothetical protein n=1 Tax=Burkholderia sp. 22PA0106 TaxID=3237371 RepID=UPI0039C2E9A6